MKIYSFTYLESDGMQFSDSQLASGESPDNKTQINISNEINLKNYQKKKKKGGATKRK